MTTRIETDLCVIGAGAGGLSVAAGAAQMGARTVLIERGRMGGECLNSGCVPSKALLAAARAAASARRAPDFGVDCGDPAVDFAAVHRHVHDVIAAIAPVDSRERFEGLGVRVIAASARFTGPETVSAGDCEVRARRFVVATGSRPAVPPIPGLTDGPFLTNETVFARDTLPAHLIIIGGGPIGMEMAQAHRRLGSRVTVLERARILPRDDAELAGVLRTALTGEGVDLREGAAVVRVEHTAGGVAVVCAGDGGEVRVAGSDLLVAVGREPTVDGLGLDEAGIAADARGIRVDRRMRTTNRRVFAVGDVTGGAFFTHLAGYQAGIVLKNALFRLPARTDTRALPWVTVTEPELAQVGLTEAEAASRHRCVRTLRSHFADNDRARADRQDAGMVKVVTTGRGRILGVGIAGPHAGELILPWVLAVSRRLPIGALATVIAPYPTLGDASKRAAGSFYTDALFSARTARLVRFLARFG